MKAKLVSESLEGHLREVAQGKHSKPTKVKQDAKEKAKEAIKGLKVQLKELNKPGSGRTLAGNKQDIKSVKDKIAKWEKKMKVDEGFEFPGKSGRIRRKGGYEKFVQPDWSLSGLKQIIAKAGVSPKIMDESDDHLILEINTFEEAKALGSISWGIVYDERMWEMYNTKFATIYFVYDFAKGYNNPNSLVGVNVLVGGEIDDVINRDDRHISIDEISHILDII